MDVQQSLPYLITLASFGFGLLLGHWWLAFFPLVAWLSFFVGLDEGWWGYGYGDGWTYAFIIWTGIGIAAFLVGLLVRWLRYRKRPTPSSVRAVRYRARD